MVGFFDEPKAQADFGFWSKMARWTVDEATALSLGKSPDFLHPKSMEAYPAPSSPFALEYKNRRRLLLRMYGASDSRATITPAEFVARAEPLGLSLPKELVDAVRATGSRIDDIASITAERDALREEVRQLRENATKEKPLASRERETLLKMIIGMAIEQYRYDPNKRNAASQQISSDLSLHDIDVTDDTVRTWLKRASGLLSSTALESLKS